MLRFEVPIEPVSPVPPIDLSYGSTAIAVLKVFDALEDSRASRKLYTIKSAFRDTLAQKHLRTARADLREPPPVGHHSSSRSIRSRGSL